MINLFRAEWRKINGHFWVAGTLIWIFPLVAIGVIVFEVSAVLLSEQFRLAMLNYPDRMPWTGQVISAWRLINSDLGRGVILIFTAFMFAGEYQWGTWKNIIPRTRRVPLIAAKFLTLGVFVVVAFTAMTLVLAFGTMLMALVAGGQIYPALTSETLSDFLPRLALQVLQTFTMTMISASYAALAGMLTRSILGGIVGGILLMLAEQTTLLVIALISGIFPALERLYVLYLLTPSYNIANINAWLTDKMAYVPGPTLARTTEPNSLEGSLALIALWVIGLVGLVIFLFKRQDITS